MSHIKYDADINFLPTISGTTTAGVGTYTTQAGISHLVGNLIFVSIVLSWIAHTATGNMIVTNLPATVSNIASYSPVASVFIQSILFPATGGYVTGKFKTNANEIDLFYCTSNVLKLPIAMSNAGQVHISEFYLTTQVI